MNQTMHEFDDRNITWYRLDWLEHLSFYIYDVTENSVDILFRFDPNRQVALHRHHTPYFTFVVQGELRFHRPDGTPKEIRGVGSYVLGQAGSEPHTEGAGEQGAIVFFGNRDVRGPIYEFLDADLKQTHLFTLDDARKQLEVQRADGATGKVGSRPA